MRFDWENKWLRGDQYAHMLLNINEYCKQFDMQKLGEKQHPENIYVQPESKFKYTPNSSISFVRFFPPQSLYLGL